MGLSALLFLLICVACSEDAVHLPTGSLQSGIKIRTAAFGTQGTTTALPAEKQISNLQAYLFSGKALVRSFTDLSVGSDSICRIDADNETGKLYFLANIDAEVRAEIYEQMQLRKGSREQLVENIKHKIHDRLEKDFDPVPLIEGRVKSNYGIYKKVYRDGKEIDRSNPDDLFD